MVDIDEVFANVDFERLFEVFFVKCLLDPSQVSENEKLWSFGFAGFVNWRFEHIQLVPVRVVGAQPLVELGEDMSQLLVLFFVWL